MTRSDHDHRRLAHHAATGGHHPHHDRYHAVRRVGRRQWSRLRRGVVRLARRPVVRRMFWGATVAFAFVVVVMVALWWRLSSGPIELDAATPWLKSAIEKNFGDKQTVTVGGTQIERDENGRTSLRLRDIVVRDSDGTVVASAPKAEVGISGLALLSGKVQAESLNLVGAEMSVRIEMDGRVTVFAGGDKRPIAIASPTLQSPSAPSASAQTQVGTVQAGIQDIAGILTWIDSLGATGLDGHDLRELGLKDGNLIVDDQRNGKRWTFSRIDVSLTRPKAGGVAFRLASDTPERPWVLSAAMRPLGGGVRAVGVEARKVSANDILLAMRLKDVAIDTDVPLSASVRAEIAGDGTLQGLQGQVIADEGTVAEHDSGKTYKLDSADIRFNWDAAQRALIVPFQIQSAGNQFTLRATLQVSPDQKGVWLLNLTRGDPVIDPIILPGGKADEDGLALNRVALRARIDTMNHRIDVDQGDFGRMDTRSAFNVAFAVTGSLDYSDAEPHLAFGIAGTQMTASVMKRMWPVFAAGQVREWVAEHISGGIVERVVIAGNAPLPNFKEGGPALSEDEFSVDIETSGTTLHPLPNLPAIRDADLTAHITGRVATVSLGRGTVEVTPGRKLNIASGIFTVPDTQVKPSSAKVTFRIDGTTAAVAALLATDALRDNVGIVLDPATIRGTVAAQATIDMLIGRKVPKNSWTYTIAADLTNFAADKVLMGQKIEASSLRTTATSEGYQITGDVKINGTPATIDLSRKKGEAYALLHLQAMLDEAARRRLGIDVGSAVAGAIPVKVTALVSNDGKDAPMNVDADLTPVTIDNLLPGWVKAAGKPAHATYTLLRGGPSVRFDDLSISGSGTNVNGSLELDSAGDIVAANFPVFAISEGDKVSLKADRGSDGALRVAMRGDIFDGTNFVKSSLAGAADKHNPTDLDLDIKIGTVIGNNGETLRGLDLKLTRRADRIRTFAMTSKIGRDTLLNGDMRLRAIDNHQVIFFETDDAGALFRFTNMYSRMLGGQMWVAMDPPTSDRTAQLGILSIRNFTVRGEPGLERVIAGGPGQTETVPFTDLHCEFTRAPGRVAVRDGVVRGPVVGVTIEGLIDYLKDDIHLRGTFVPFYDLNNMFGQIPIVGLILGGGSNEGLVGVTYEASGSPSAPRISVNPVTAITPGLLRKFIPSPGSFDSNYVPPSRSEVR